MVAKADKIRLSYGLRVTLLDTKPAVWRRFSVPGEITLDRLHDVLQIVMGWEDRHLHLFTIEGNTYSEDPEEEWEGEEERHHRLCDLVGSAPAQFEYKYDMGDGWNHKVEVEKISPVGRGHVAATKCLAGKRRCPPEDVGGTPGYANFVKAYKDPKHPEHKRHLQWIGGSFDPNDFDPETVTLELYKYARWSRPRATQLHLNQGFE